MGRAFSLTLFLAVTASVFYFVGAQEADSDVANIRTKRTPGGGGWGYNPPPPPPQPVGWQRPVPVQPVGWQRPVEQVIQPVIAEVIVVKVPQRRRHKPHNVGWGSGGGGYNQGYSSGGYGGGYGGGYSNNGGGWR